MRQRTVASLEWERAKRRWEYVPLSVMIVGAVVSLLIGWASGVLVGVRIPRTR